MHFEFSHLHLKLLHLPTLGNNHIIHRLTFSPHPRILNLLHDIHPLNHLTKHDVLVVEIRSGYRGDEKLASVGVGSRILSESKISAKSILCPCGRGKSVRTYSHTQEPGHVMLHLEVFVGEGFGAINGRTAGAITVEEIPALDHETFDLPENNKSMIRNPCSKLSKLPPSHPHHNS